MGNMSKVIMELFTRRSKTFLYRYNFDCIIPRIYYRNFTERLCTDYDLL